MPSSPRRSRSECALTLKPHIFITDLSARCYGHQAYYPVFNIKQAFPSCNPAFMNTNTDSNTVLSSTGFLLNYERNRGCTLNTDGHINALWHPFTTCFKVTSDPDTIFPHTPRFVTFPCVECIYEVPCFPSRVCITYVSALYSYFKQRSIWW